MGRKGLGQVMRSKELEPGDVKQGIVIVLIDVLSNVYDGEVQSVSMRRGMISL